jgi:hypothetical protein
MAEIIQLRRPCVQVEPVSVFGWLREHLRWRRRLPSADDLPNRLRRDVGLPGRACTKDYRDYLASNGR